MELLREQCCNHELYPKHLSPSSKSLGDYFARLETRLDSLFCGPEDALLETLDLKAGEQGWWFFNWRGRQRLMLQAGFSLQQAETLLEVQEICPLPPDGGISDSGNSLRCRFMCD
jgi:hypothetical protein